MAARTGEELEVTWAREKNALRHECHVKLRQKLLNLAQAHMLKLVEDRHTSHPLEDKILTDLQQKLETITLSGKRLSQVFMNSLAATFSHRLSPAGTISKNTQSNDLALEESSAAQKDDAYYYDVSGRSISASNPPLSEIKSQAPDRFTDTLFRHPPHSRVIAVKDEYSPPRIKNRGELTEEDFLDSCVLGRRFVDGTLDHGAQAELASLVRARADLHRRVSEQRIHLARRSVYLRECRAAAEKEKETMQKLLTTARLSLSAAEIGRAIAANDRITALEELKHATLPGNHSQTQHIACASLGIKDLGASEETLDYSAPTAWAVAHQLRHDTVPCTSPPLLTCPSTFTALTPPESLDSMEFSSHTDDTSSTPAVTIGDKRMCPKHLVEFKENQELRESTVTSHPAVKDEMARTLENPIGPYIRPPMPLEDMLKCVRCLFGKDKSLKTGNRARAFLGVPWSQIVSFDPDVLLARGVLGIKEGSTGMASRLRMMTIIESALSNQNDDVSNVMWLLFVLTYDSYVERPSLQKFGRNRHISVRVARSATQSPLAQTRLWFHLRDLGSECHLALVTKPQQTLRHKNQVEQPTRRAKETERGYDWHDQPLIDYVSFSRLNQKQHFYSPD
jgi:hypothetical protein